MERKKEGKISCPVCLAAFAPRHSRHKFCCITCLERDRHIRHKFRRNAAKIEQYQRNKVRIREELRLKYASDPEYRKRLKDFSSANWKKILKERPWYPFITSAKRRAVTKGIKFNLTQEWGEKVWTGRCSITGLEFVLGIERNPRSPSLDRIDPKLGYVKNNCRFVLWAINTFKAESTDEEMFEIASAIVTKFRKS